MITNTNFNGTERYLFKCLEIARAKETSEATLLDLRDEIIEVEGELGVGTLCSPRRNIANLAREIRKEVTLRVSKRNLPTILETANYFAEREIIAIRTTSKKMLKALSYDRSVCVRKAVAQNSFASDETLRFLSNDPDCRIREIVAAKLVRRSHKIAAN